MATHVANKLAIMLPTFTAVLDPLLPSIQVELSELYTQVLLLQHCLRTYGGSTQISRLVINAQLIPPFRVAAWLIGNYVVHIIEVTLR